uniref:Pinopsin-like n=1 Tax=Echeneis naucrates TaxID=173247 RepID=A0A665U490_ECHNA
MCVTLRLWVLGFVCVCACVCSVFNAARRSAAPVSLHRLSRGGHRVVSVFLGCIMVLGLLNNLLVLVLFCRFRTLRTPVNMLLLNISVSDMLVCLCGTTLSFASSLRGRWLYGRHGCLWYGFINSCFGIVSLISLAVLSYDRYSTLMVCNKRAPDYRRPLLAVGGSWLYSVGWTVPPLLGWSSYGPEGAGTSCSVTWTDRTSRSHSYIICLFIFCLGLPVLVMVYCYGRLLYAVKQVGHIRRSAARHREFHILFMVITTVVCYLLCWMPYGVVAMMATFGQPGLISPVASVIPSILAKSSTVINPIIYILMNKQVFKVHMWSNSVWSSCRLSPDVLGPGSAEVLKFILDQNRSYSPSWLETTSPWKLVISARYDGHLSSRPVGNYLSWFRCGSGLTVD